jgi:hypothetical protein
VDFPLKLLSAATFGDDVPVVRAGSPLLQLLAEGEQIKAGEQTKERRGIAIDAVTFSLDLVDYESVRSDRAANAVIRIASTAPSPAAARRRPPPPQLFAAPVGFAIRNFGLDFSTKIQMAV